MSRETWIGFLAGLALAAGVSLAARAQPAEPAGRALTLEEARARTLERSPELRAASASLAAVEGALKQARALPNPDLSFEVEDFGGNRPADSRSQRTLSVGGRVEWFGKRSARVSAVRLERDVAAADLERRRRDLLREADRRFVALLAVQERLAIAEEDRTTAGEVRRAVAALVAAGEVSPVEEMRVAGDEALARIERDAAARDAADAARALAQLWAEPADASVRAAGVLASEVSVPDLDAMLEGLRRLPDLARWDAESARRTALESLARKQALPDLTLSAGARSYEGAGGHAWVAGVSLPVPLLTSAVGARAEASARLEEARQERRAEESRLRAALLSAHGSLVSAGDEAGLLDGTVLPNARRVYEALGEGYRRGKFRLLDLLEARRSLSAARLRAVDARTRLAFAAADVRRLSPEEPPAEKRGLE